MPHAHAPVKWIVELANVGDDPLDSVEHVIVTEGNREIADCGRAAHKANHTRARLIAAAPSLKDAAHLALQALRHAPLEGPYGSKAKRALEVALAEAEGRKL